MNVKLQQIASEALVVSLSSLLKTEAYLAGGMLRDHFFNRPGNDFDIYVEYDPSFDYDTWMIPMLNGAFGYSDFIKLSQENSQYATNDIHSIYEGNFSAANIKTKTQIIFLQNIRIRYYIEKYFCCDLSKVWQTQGFSPVYTRDFMEAVKTKKMSFDFRRNGKISFPYIDKMVERFPDFDIDEKTASYYVKKLTTNSYWANDLQ